MKILFIHNYYQYYGGEETYFHSLTKLLQQKGHEVITYTKDSKDIKTFWDKIKAGIGLFWNKSVEKELSQLIKEQKSDIVHFNNIYPLIGATAYRVCKKFNIPIIQHIHNYRFMCPKGILFRDGKICELCVKKSFPFYSILFGCYHSSQTASLFFSFAFFLHKTIGTFNLIDKFIFPSEFTRNYYLKNLDISKEKIEVIPYFVDVEEKKVKNVKKKDYFLFVGRLSEEKGIIQLLEVFKTLPKQKLIVIGDGPLRKEVERYKKYTNITIVGFLAKDKILPYVRKARVVILPSLWYEVLPLVLLEALSQNTPILIPDNENFKLMVNDMKNSNRINYYRSSDRNDLKNEIIAFSQTRIESKGSKTIKQMFNYTTEKHYDTLLKLYQRVLRTL